MIELLLIISIIGLIFSIIVANLQDARQASRDAAIKQQVRTTATLFEYQRNQSGSYLNYQAGRVRNDVPGQACSDIAWQGTFATKLQELCEGITNQAEYAGIIIQYAVMPAFRDGNHFSIMAQLNNGNWYCVGSNGGTSEGPYNINANGCANNP